MTLQRKCFNLELIVCPTCNSLIKELSVFNYVSVAPPVGVELVDCKCTFGDVGKIAKRKKLLPALTGTYHFGQHF